MKKRMKELTAFVLCFAMIVTSFAFHEEVAAKKKTKVKLNKSKLSLYVGKKAKLKVKGTKKKVVWKTSKKKIATVSKKGVVRAKKKGKAMITAKVAEKKLRCKVTVKKKTTPKPTKSVVVTPKPTTSGNKNTPKPVTPTADMTSKSTPIPQVTATPTATPVLENPVFSKNSGSYKDEFELTLSASKGSKIYYTTDGSVPLYEDEQEIKQGTPFTISKEKEEFASDDYLTTQYGSDGVTIDFSKRYRSVCLKTPESITDWSGYEKIAIEYTVNSIGNKNSSTLGLQVAPIYANATSSWDNSSGSDTTRIKENSIALSKGHGVTFVSLKDGSNYSSVGRLMFGVYNENDTTVNGTPCYSGKDSITIHAVHLLKADEKYQIKDDSSVPKKLPTKEYTGAITVKNRDTDANLLCSSENIPFMYDPTDVNNGPYDPADYDTIVPKATIIRAVAVDAEGNKSGVVTKVYFVNKDLQTVYKNASVISIVTDPDNLLSSETGIYRYGNWANSGKNWERPAEVTYFEEDGTIPFETTMGLRIHGNYTRRWGQKSLRLYCREELGGLKNIKYQLIPGATNADGKAKKKYKRFILRNGGNEYAYSKMQDVFIQSMVSDRAFTTQSSRPCVCFLNGEYWGVYNLTERYSDNYLEEEFDVDKDNVIIVKNKELDSDEQEGDLEKYNELVNMANLDMTKSDNYEAFEKMVDMQSLMDYYATGIYIGNNDWPDNNTQLWRTRENDGTTYGDTKWRYMLYDTEYSMNLWGCDNGGTKDRIAIARQKDTLFDALCNNTEFQKKFSETLMDICRNNFEVTKANKKLDEMAAVYRPLIAQYKERFGNGDVDSRVTAMKSYIAGREEQLKGFIQTNFGITVE